MKPEHWRRIEQLYHAALERDERERAAFVQQACAGDEDLRWGVESLLAQEGKTASVLEAPAMEGAAKAMAQEQTPNLVGRQLGHYHVLAQIGAGGMGEVYRAKDTKLRREVALKVLPPALARDPERLARFRREAQLLASLNHPNIAAIYGLEEAHDPPFLVLELVEGETLADRIARAGPLPAGEALPLCKQVAEALEYAHKKAVTHRDIKPANIKVTPEGQVKVLDFGLAKAFEGEQAGVGISALPTLSAAPTKEGQILGTPAYMSPEQVRGKGVDKQTDIWAFGCLLYELLTGQYAFRGETVSDTIVRVLEREPDWQTLPPSTSASILTLLRRCLQKDANGRLHDIADARIEIEEALSRPSVAVPPGPAGPVTRAWRRELPSRFAGLVAVTLAVAVGVAVWIIKPSSPPALQRVTRFTLTLPPGDRLANLDRHALALSPDGTQLAYVASRGGGPPQIFLRSLESFETKPIPGTEGASAPFFSPDGQWVGFFAVNALKKVSIAGGAPVNVTYATGTVPSATWGPDGAIVFQSSTAGGLRQVSAAGGAPQAATTVDSKKNEVSHRWPEFLPGGRAVLFNAGVTNTGGWDSAQVALQLLETGERRDLIAGGTRPSFASSGHLVYAQSGTLMAAPFDLERLEVTGTPVPLVDGVVQSPASGVAQYSLSANGSLAYIPGGLQASQRTLVWVDRKGAEEPLAALARAYRQPRLSPDGRRVAVSLEERETHIWLYDLARETLTRFTFEGNSNLNPLWSSDSKRIAFQSALVGARGILWQLADGSGGLERLTSSENAHAPASWSPDGKLLVFLEVHPTTGRDLWVLPMKGERKPQPLLRTPFDESAAVFSPDGRWLAYASNESGPFEIYAQPFPGPGGKWQISTEGGTEPAWNPNGRELFYRNGNRMMAVDIMTHPSFSAGKPRLLFERPDLPTPGTLRNYDVTADGQRFLLLKPTEPQAAAPMQVHVVLNWFEELKRRVPSGQ